MLVVVVVVVVGVLLVGVGVIQESFSWVKIKLHVDFQPTSLLLLMLKCERSELAALELPVFSGGFGRGQGV